MFVGSPVVYREGFVPVPQIGVELNLPKLSFTPSQVFLTTGQTSEKHEKYIP